MIGCKLIHSFDGGGKDKGIKERKKRVEDEDPKLPPAEFERSFPVVRNKNRLNKCTSSY